MNPQGQIAFQTANQIGTNLSQAFTQRKDENAIESILSQASQSGDPAQLQGAIGKILSQVSPERQGPAIQYLEQVYNNVQQKQKMDRYRQASTQEGINPDLPESLQKIQLQNKLTPAKQAPAPKPTPFDTRIQQKQADNYIQAQEEIPKLQSTLKTIENMEKLANKLKGPSGYLKSALGSKDAAEFDATGLTLIEPIVKIFNPVGAIPTQKIDLIKSKFAPKASDTNRTITGKLNAIKAFTNQALERNKQRIQLINEYNGNPPLGVVENFDKETESLIDAMDAYPISDKDKIKVKSPEGVEGEMTLENFERAKKAGKKYERI